MSQIEFKFVTRYTLRGVVGFVGAGCGLQFIYLMSNPEELFVNSLLSGPKPVLTFTRTNRLRNW